MSLQETNKRIETLFKEWRELQPLKPEDKERFDKKVRLEWNYNSNHIEGNTLTYGETELLLIFGRADGNHPLRDYEEMKAHDLAINKVREFAEDKERNLTEADIRDLNKLIIKEPFWKEAETPDGKPTKKQIVPGQYKRQPNHVRTRTGEIFKFAEPNEVPAKMAELIKWFNESIDSVVSTPSFLSELHYRFVRIHPFDDGNGRAARLWVNYALLRIGYPPLVIKTKDKDEYFGALEKADVGDIDAFTTFIGKNLVHWLEIGIKAAKGEDISEPEDVDKESELFIRKQKIQRPVRLSIDVAYEDFDNSWGRILDTFEEKFSGFEELFYSTEKKVNDSELVVNELLKSLCNGYLVDNKVDIDKKKWGFIRYEIKYHHYTPKEKKRDFDMKTDMTIEMREFEYAIRISTHAKNGAKGNMQYSEEKKKGYNEHWSDDEIKKFIADGKQNFLKALKEATGVES